MLFLKNYYTNYPPINEYYAVYKNGDPKFYLLLGLHLPLDNHRIMNILIGLSVIMMSVFLIILLYSCCSAKKSKSQEQACKCHLSSVRNQNWKNTGMCSSFTKGYLE